VLKHCIEARTALGELKQAAELIPNQTMLINTIPLLEAKDSSEINIVTTTDLLFQHAQSNDGHADAATKEALRYRTALYRGFSRSASVRSRPIRRWKSAARSKASTWISVRCPAFSLPMIAPEKSSTRHLKGSHTCESCSPTGALSA
jgi:hypothetical protein